MFRCMWPNENNNSKTFFIAEQVSHHPPVSAFYCSNRKDGYAIGGSILAKSKFYGKRITLFSNGLKSWRKHCWKELLESYDKMMNVY